MRVLVLEEKSLLVGGNSNRDGFWMALGNVGLGVGDNKDDMLKLNSIQFNSGIMEFWNCCLP